MLSINIKLLMKMVSKQYEFDAQPNFSRGFDLRFPTTSSVPDNWQS